MTKEERMEIIRNKAKNDEIEREKEINEKEKRYDELITQINDLEKRISDIVDLANECTKNGIDIPEKRYSAFGYNAAKRYGYDAEFIADGIRHHTGLIRTWAWGRRTHGIYEWVGIENGGCCGPYDFRTNGLHVFSIHEDDGSKIEPRIEDMEQFVKEFPVFEKAFYSWIDSLM